MDLQETLLIIPGILLGFSFHEYAHAQVAVWLGDNTPKYQGRLSLSPLVHIDIFGFIMLLFAGFGWAKPVEIDERNFKNPKRDDILVSIAGPLMNLLLAILFVLLMRVLYVTPIPFLSDGLYNTIMDVLDYTVWINVVLFVFNLLPVPPLDGSHIFFGLLGLKEKGFYYEIYSKGRFILLLLIITNVLDKIISPPIVGIYNNLFGLLFF